MIYLIGLIFLLSIVSKSICDKIKFQRIPKGDWWLAEGKYRWDKRIWLTKNIFSFVSDGWHFFDAVRVMSLCIVVVLCLNIPIYWAIGLYVIHGAVFEILYRIK